MNRKSFKDILTFLGLNYKDASLITLYLVEIVSVFQKSDEMITISHKKIVKKVENQLVLNENSGKDYRVATLPPKSYLTVIGICMQSLKSIGQFKHV